jgi:hypothetical protein
MAKWFGTVGYAVCKEVRPGVWQDEITKRQYFGDVMRSSVRWSPSSDSTNDDLNLDKQISIVADPFAELNFRSIKFVEFMGVMWKVTNVNPQHPRIVLTIGGEYNGPQA